MKISGPESCFAVLQADRLQGPYETVQEDYYPLGNSVGDFDLVANADGKAYLYADTSPKRVAGFELSEDYCTVAREVTSQYEGLFPPFCREGVTLFARGDKKYLLTSGTTGYTPNQSDVAVSASWTEPFVSLGDPHVDDDTMSSFNNQVSQSFPLPGNRQLYVKRNRSSPFCKKILLYIKCLPNRQAFDFYPKFLTFLEVMASV